MTISHDMGSTQESKDICLDLHKHSLNPKNHALILTSIVALPNQIDYTCDTQMPDFVEHVTPIEPVLEEVQHNYHCQKSITHVHPLLDLYP